jgi:hypothetical protein
VTGTPRVDSQPVGLFVLVRTLSISYISSSCICWRETQEGKRPSGQERPVNKPLVERVVPRTGGQRPTALTGTDPCSTPFSTSHRELLHCSHSSVLTTQHNSITTQDSSVSPRIPNEPSSRFIRMNAAHIAGTSSSMADVLLPHPLVALRSTT